MPHRFLIAIHGSVLSCPSPRDIDVIVAPGDYLELHRPHIETIVRAWAAEHGYDLDGSLPLDIQECQGIPGLPASVPPAYEVIQGELPTHEPIRIQYDLAAWIRACETSEAARVRFGELYANEKNINPSGAVEHISFCIASKATLVNCFGRYFGGGRVAVATAMAKCPMGWAYVSGLLDVEARMLVQSQNPYREEQAFPCQMMESYIIWGAPVGTGQCYLTQGTVWTAYQRPRTWAVVAALLRGNQVMREWVSVGEREFLADLLAHERTASLGEGERLINKLVKLAQYGKTAWDDAVRTRKELSLIDGQGGIAVPALLDPELARDRITLLNTSIITGDGVHSLRRITVDDARVLVANASQVDSAIGHQATADILADVLGVPVPMNRQAYASKAGDTALVFKLKGRPPEGRILTLEEMEEMEEIGYDFYVQVHIGD